MRHDDDTSQPILSNYLTKLELARELNCSPRTIERLHRLRQGPPRTRVGRRLLYRREAVRQWLEDQEAAEVCAK